jgi:hypothetical protein
MIIRCANTKASTRRTLARALMLVLLVLIAVSGSSALAAQTKSKPKAKRRVIPVTINKGQNYTISGIEVGATATPKVVNNPNALVMQTAPGRIELVGADSGVWKINATLATGEKVAYLITVKAITPPQGTLAPTAAPTAIP